MRSSQATDVDVNDFLKALFSNVSKKSIFAWQLGIRSSELVDRCVFEMSSSGNSRARLAELAALSLIFSEALPVLGDQPFVVTAELFGRCRSDFGSYLLPGGTTCAHADERTAALFLPAPFERSKYYRPRATVATVVRETNA